MSVADMGFTNSQDIALRILSQAIEILDEEFQVLCACGRPLLEEKRKDWSIGKLSHARSFFEKLGNMSPDSDDFSAVLSHLPELMTSCAIVLSYECSFPNGGDQDRIRDAMRTMAAVRDFQFAVEKGTLNAS